MQFRMHVATNVADLEENLKFYRAFFSAEPTRVKHDGAKFELNNPPLLFSMNVRPYGQKGALNHLGFQVGNAEAVLAVKQRLQHSEFESAGGPAVQGESCAPSAVSEFIGLKKIVYFLCTGNSCRSQMAEGWGKHFGKDKVEVYSAGIETHGLNPRAVAAMKEAGIDISGQTSDLIDPEILNKADYVITLCGDANDKCPVTPPHVKRLHWGFEDPAKATGTEEEIMAKFREVRDAIGARIKTFFDEILA